MTICKEFWQPNKFDDNFRKEIESIYKSIRFAVRGYRCVVITVTFIMSPTEHLLARKPGFPIDIWQPVDINGTPYYPIAFVILYAVGLFVAIVSIGVDTLFMALMTYTICQFKICGHAFCSVGMADIKTKEDEAECWREMKMIINYHNHIIR